MTTNIRCLSIQQPWAWLILHRGKDIENRTWSTTYRGRFLIHAGLKIDAEALTTFQDNGIIPPNQTFPTGGIVGRAELIGCVGWARNYWFHGPFGFVLQNAQELPLFRCAGKLMFFKPPTDIPEKYLR